jgi:hypothetical protein
MMFIERQGLPRSRNPIEVGTGAVGGMILRISGHGIHWSWCGNNHFQFYLVWNSEFLVRTRSSNGKCSEYALRLSKHGQGSRTVQLRSSFVIGYSQSGACLPAWKDTRSSQAFLPVWTQITATGHHFRATTDEAFCLP